MKKRKGVSNKSISNRTVIIVLILVVLVSVISLGIYVSALDDFNQKEAPKVSGGEVSLVIDNSVDTNSVQNLSNEPPTGVK